MEVRAVGDGILRKRRVGWAYSGQVEFESGSKRGDTPERVGRDPFYGEGDTREPSEEYGIIINIIIIIIISS